MHTWSPDRKCVIIVIIIIIIIIIIITIIIFVLSNMTCCQSGCKTWGG